MVYGSISIQMTNTLVVATALSESLLTVMVQESIRNPVMVVGTPDVAQALRQIGFDAHDVSVQIKQDWETRDKQFASLAMPGKLLDFNFPTTEMHVWGVMALDRLSFWYRQGAIPETELIDKLVWDKAIISLDIQHPLPFAVARLCAKRGLPCVGVQVAFMQSIEWADMVAAGWLDDLSQIVVGRKDTCDWLIKQNFHLPEIHWLAEAEVKKEVTKEERASARAGLGLEDFQQVSFIPYDARVEHQIRRYLQTAKEKCVLWPVNSRIADKMGLLLGPGIMSRVVIAGDYLSHVGCDRMLVWRSDEYGYKSRIPVEAL